MPFAFTRELLIGVVIGLVLAWLYMSFVAGKGKAS